MVNFLASQATTTITVTPLAVATNLVISAPASVVQGEIFLITGQLTRADTGAALEHETISVSYNGQSLGTPVTDVVGAYSLQAVIPETGNYTLTADFAGSTRPGLVLLPSRAQAPVTMPGIPEITPLIGAIAVGVVIIGAYIIAKRR